MTPPTPQPEKSLLCLELNFRPKLPKYSLEWKVVITLILLLTLQSFSCYSNSINIAFTITTVFVIGVLDLFGIFIAFTQSDRNLLFFLKLSPLTVAWTLFITIWMTVLVLLHDSKYYHSGFHITAIATGYFSIFVYFSLIYFILRVRKFWANQKKSGHTKEGLNTIPFKLENHGDFSAYQNNLNPIPSRRPSINFPPPPPSEIIITPSAPLPEPTSFPDPFDLNYLPSFEINETPILSTPTTIGAPTTPGQSSLYPSLADVQASPLAMYQNIPSHLFDQVPSAPIEEEHS